jgi:hypothetical protein
MNKLLPQFFNIALFLFALGFSSQSIRAQTAPQTTADENYQLNIGESRTTETNYERTTLVQLSFDRNQANVSIGVGAAVRAEKITITLRGITGNVRFRASLETLRRRIEQLSPNRLPENR